MSDHSLEQKIDTLQQWINALQYRVTESSLSLNDSLSETLEGFLSTLEEQFQQTQMQPLLSEITGEVTSPFDSSTDTSHLVQTFGEIFLALTTKTHRDAVLDEIINQVQNLISYTAANIMLLEDNTLRVAKHQGYDAFGNTSRLSGLKQSLGSFPLDAQVIEQRKPLVVPDTKQNPLWVTTPQGYWIRSFIAIPICLQDRVLGLFRLDSDTPEQFSESDIPRLIPVAGAAAIALENARLYDQVQQGLIKSKQAEEEILKLNHKLVSLQFAGATIAASLDLQQVLRVITSEMETILDVDKSVVYEWDYESGVLSNPTNSDDLTNTSQQHISLNDLPITREVIDTPGVRRITVTTDPGNPILLAYLQERQAQTILLLPMEFQERVVGLAEIIDEHHIRNFSIDEIAIAQLIANQAASAIQNARLYEQARKEVEERKRAEEKLAQSEAQLLQEIQSILAINDVLVTETETSKLLGFITLQAEKLTGADGVAVLILDDTNARFELVTTSHTKLRQRLGAQLPLQGAIAHQAINTRKVQISDQVSAEERATPVCDLLRPAKIQSLLCAPLSTSNKNLGVLLVWHTDGTRLFASRDGELIGMFANQAALALQNAELHTKNRELAIQQERNRLARELHDTVTQSLYSIALSAKTSLRLLDMSDNNSKGDIQEPLDLISTLAQEALTDMREQIYDLASPVSQDGNLGTLLKQSCELFSTRHGLKIDLIISPDLNFTAEQADALSCITREALWNIVKHAQSTHVEIAATKRNKHLELSIKDNGIGLDFNPHKPLPREKMGLRSMRIRAQHIGGELKIESRTESICGTNIIVRIPQIESP